MRAGAERYSFLAGPLEGAPAAGVGQDNASGQVHTVDLDVISGVREIPVSRRPQLDVVIAARRHVDGIGEPLSGLEVVDDVASAKGVGRQDDVDVFAQPVLAAGVTLDVVVIGD